MHPQERTRLYWCLVHDRFGTIALAVLADDDGRATSKSRAICSHMNFDDAFEVREGDRLVHAEQDSGHRSPRVA